MGVEPTTFALRNGGRSFGRNVSEGVRERQSATQAGVRATGRQMGRSGCRALTCSGLVISGSKLAAGDHGWGGQSQPTRSTAVQLPYFPPDNSRSRAWLSPDAPSSFGSRWSGQGSPGVWVGRMGRVPCLSGAPVWAEPTTKLTPAWRPSRGVHWSRLVCPFLLGKSGVRHTFSAIIGTGGSSLETSGHA